MMQSLSPRYCKVQATEHSCQENGMWVPMTLPNTGLKNTLAHWQAPRRTGTPTTSFANLMVARCALTRKASFTEPMPSLTMRLTFFRKDVKHLISPGFYTWLTILLTFPCRHPNLRLRNMPKPINQVGIKSGNSDPAK